MEFNLLWLEFQNTRWLMHIAFGAVPSRLCSRTSSYSPLRPRSPENFPTTHVCALLYGPLPSLRGQCKLILSCSKRREASPSLPSSLANFPIPSIRLSVSLCLSNSLSYSFVLSRVNDIYAMLIEISPLYAPACITSFSSRLCL